MKLAIESQSSPRCLHDAPLHRGQRGSSRRFEAGDGSVTSFERLGTMPPVPTLTPLTPAAPRSVAIASGRYPAPSQGEGPTRDFMPTPPALATYKRDATGASGDRSISTSSPRAAKVWGRLKGVVEANSCVPQIAQVLDAARKAGLHVFYALHRRYRRGDYETWTHIAPVQRAAWLSRAFAYGTWGGELRSEFLPQPGEIVASSIRGCQHRSGPAAQEARHPSAHRHRAHRARRLPRRCVSAPY